MFTVFIFFIFVVFWGVVFLLFLECVFFMCLSTVSGSIGRRGEGVSREYERLYSNIEITAISNHYYVQ